ncbi:MAG: hypothetical protein ACT4QD_06860, partial [Acidobacteriota bacterium]
PERFVKGRPHPADLPSAVWINPPVKTPSRQDVPGATIVGPDDLQHGRVLDAPRRSTTLVIDVGAPVINATSVSQCH